MTPRRILGLLVRSSCVLAARAGAADVVEYYHLDALGNVRLITDENGDVVERHDYYPFGEECTTGPCATNPGVGAGQPRKFTGKERDAETGLDYFGARYYGSKIGRFTTVDPVYTWNDNLLDPQRWNRYAYGRDNPFRYVDPDGRAIVPKAIKLIVKGGDIASTFAGAVDDVAILVSADPTVGAPARLLALGSLLSEAAPVSGRDIKEGGELLGRGARFLFDHSDEAGETLGFVYKRTNPKSGVSYIGRSKSPETFLQRQATHDRTFGVKHEYEIVDRATPGTPLRAAEESAIKRMEARDRWQTSGTR